MLTEAQNAILAALDFDPAYQCDFKSHEAHEWHGGAVSRIVQGSCPQCHSRTAPMAICDNAWNMAFAAKTVCRNCGNSATREEVWTVLTYLL